MKISAPLPTNTLSSIHTSETCSVAPTTYGEKVYLCHPSEDVHKWSMGSNKESPTTFGVNYADPHDNSNATLPDKTDVPPKNVPKEKQVPNPQQNPAGTPLIYVRENLAKERTNEQGNRYKRYGICEGSGMLRYF